MITDRLLRQGAITEIVGPLSSGRTSLFVACLRDVTRRGAVAAVVDTDQALDPASAARAGVDLSRVLWVRCGGRRDRALRAADRLVRCPGFALIGLDLGEPALRLASAAAFRLKFAIERTDAALLIVGRWPIAGPGASLVVETVRRGLDWAGPGLEPTRLARLLADVRVLRARPFSGAPVAAPPLAFCA